MITLYHFPRSSASYRVRIALNLKGVTYQCKLIDFRKDEQRSDEYLAHNPQGLVPTLEIDGRTISQS
jgi:glutathione S-transferase